MSLVSELKSPGSPVAKHLQERFPIVSIGKRGSPLAKAPDLLGLDFPRINRVESLAPPRQRMTVGMAIDYRIRYYFELYDCESTVASQGAAVSGRRPCGSLWKEFAKSNASLMKRCGPRRECLSDEEEAELAQHCIILALYEQIYRAGPDINSPLLEMRRGASIEDLLALPQPDLVADVCNLSRAFREDARDFFEHSRVLNPTFDGSMAIGGADADMIIGDTLYDIKTYSDITAAMVREAIYQLLGYALLDYGDRYKIRKVGMYLTRQRVKWQAPIWMLIMPMEDVSRHVSQRTAPDDNTVGETLKKQRAEFRKVVQSLSKGLPDERLLFERP